MSTLDHTEPYLSEPPFELFSRAAAPERDLTRVTTQRESTAARGDARYRRVLLLADLGAGGGAIILTRWLCGGAHGVLHADLLGAILVVVLAKLLNLYDIDRVTIRRSTLDEVPRLVMLAAMVAVSWSLLDFTLGIHPTRQDGTGLLWFTLSVFLVIGRGSVRAVATRLAPPERVLIIGNARARQSIGHSLCTDPGAHIEIVGYLPFEDERRRDAGPPAGVGADRRKSDSRFDDLPAIIGALNVDRVLLAPSVADSDATLEAVRRMTALNVGVSLLPRLFEVVGSAVEFDTVGGVTVLGLRRPGLSRSSRAIKRTVDLLGSGLALALLSPVLLVAAVAIKLDSRGPVFFRQGRIGRNGEMFEILKFRSMFDGAETQREALADRNETEGLFKLDRDPRVTRVGRVLRRTSIDELPQIINVLSGDMSLVGPRPLVPAEDALIHGRHRERLTLAPGMTGPWQVLGPTRPPLAEMVKTDYLYAVTWNLWLDLKIMLRTVSHIRSGHGR